MKFGWLKKLIFYFFTFSAIWIIFARFGREIPLKNSTELVCYIKPHLPVPLGRPIVADRIPSQIEMLFAAYMAAMDKKISKITIVVSSDIELDTFQAQELMMIIKVARANKKEVVIFAENFDSNLYLVASACSKRVLIECGTVDFNGYGVVAPFEKEKYKKKRIDWIALQRGDFKGGVQHELSDGFDYYSASNLREFIQDRAAQLKELLGMNLGRNSHEIQDLFKKCSFGPPDAMKTGLIDEIGQYVPKKDEFTLEKYYLRLWKKMRYCQNRVKFVWIDQKIFKPRTRIMVEKLNKLASDENTKVVVLFLNCYGGCVQSSHMLYEAILNLRRHGKYVIAYVDFAFSGGYYVACAADKIVGLHTSKLGSIGAFGKFPQMEKYWLKKGVKFDMIGTDSFNGNLYFDSKGRNLLGFGLDYAYDTFAKVVQKARNIEPKMMEDIAQGQVFTGGAAQMLGLIDSLNGFFDLFDLIFTICGGPFWFDFVPDSRMLIDLELAMPLLSCQCAFFQDFWAKKSQIDKFSKFEDSDFLPGMLGYLNEKWTENF